MKTLKLILLAGLMAAASLGVGIAHGDPSPAPSLPAQANNAGSQSVSSPAPNAGPALVSEHVILTPTALETSQTIRHHRWADSELEQPADTATGQADQVSSRGMHRHHRRCGLVSSADSAVTTALAASPPEQIDRSPLIKAFHKSRIRTKLHSFAATAARATSLDSMTRDGSSPTSASASADGQTMSVGGVILRAILALLLVLALIVATICVLRKKGFGAASLGADSQQSTASTKTPIGTSPWAAMIGRQAAAATAAKRNSGVKPRISPFDSKMAQMTDMQILGSEDLPGTGSRLIKVRVGDRVLLLGAGPTGGLNVLTEWDIEAKPEDDQRFDEILDQMSAPSNSRRASREPESTTAGRLHETLQRLNNIGESADLHR